MTATQSRPGFRLKWRSDNLQAAAGEQRAETEMPEAAETDVRAAAFDSSSAVEPSDQFLDSLTSAMRRVAEDARETSLADARAAVAGKVAQMDAHAAARGNELRTRAEQDVADIGEWSRSEIARIEAETGRKIEQRQAQLAEQLAEHERRSAADVAALHAQVQQYEGELALFFAQLGEITDPDAFIAAARRMPRLPQGGGVPAAGDDVAAIASDDVGSADAEEFGARLRDMGIEPGADAESGDGEPPSGNGVEPVLDEAAPATEAPSPEWGEAVAQTPPPTVTPTVAPTEAPPVVAAVAAAAAPDVAATVAPEPAAVQTAEPVAEVGSTLDAAGALSSTTTTVAATGLGSFGAVTSFKTALEKADGVNSVRLSLGSGGEFMYAVSHRVELDLSPVLAAAFPGASIQRTEDGMFRLTAGKRR